MKVRKLMQLLNEMGPDNDIFVQEVNSEGGLGWKRPTPLSRYIIYAIGPISISHEKMRTTINTAGPVVSKKGVYDMFSCTCSLSAQVHVLRARRHLCVTHSHDFLLSFVLPIRYKCPRPTLRIPTPSSARRIGLGRVVNDL
jgi:hypothetical protein